MGLALSHSQRNIQIQKKLQQRANFEAQIGGGGVSGVPQKPQNPHEKHAKSRDLAFSFEKTLETQEGDMGQQGNGNGGKIWQNMLKEALKKQGKTIGGGFYQEMFLNPAHDSDDDIWSAVTDITDADNGAAVGGGVGKGKQKQKEETIESYDQGESVREKSKENRVDVMVVSRQGDHHHGDDNDDALKHNDNSHNNDTSVSRSVSRSESRVSGASSATTHRTHNTHNSDPDHQVIKMTRADRPDTAQTTPAEKEVVKDMNIAQDVKQLNEPGVKETTEATEMETEGANNPHSSNDDQANRTNNPPVAVQAVDVPFVNPYDLDAFKAELEAKKKKKKKKKDFMTLDMESTHVAMREISPPHSPKQLLKQLEADFEAEQRYTSLFGDKQERPEEDAYLKRRAIRLASDAHGILTLKTTLDHP